MWIAMLLLLFMVDTATASGQVGFTQVELADLPVTMVYPTEAAASRQRFGAFEIEVALGAPLSPAPARRPLIVMSHGTGGSALADHDLAAAFARRGFIVAQPLHAGDNHRDDSRAGPAAWQSRPQEVLHTIERLMAHPLWGPAIDGSRVGVHGTSAGGVTALVLGGARWRTLTLLQHCGLHLEADHGFCLNGAVEPAAQARRITDFQRIRGVAEAALPAELMDWHGLRQDPRRRRIGAITVSVPVAAVFRPRELARIDVPVGVVAAQADAMLAPQYHSGLLRSRCARCETLADLPGATHFDVMSPWPAAVGAALAARQPQGVATNPRFDGALRDRAYARIVEFHSRHLGLH